jgi:fluoride exporter
MTWFLIAIGSALGGIARYAVGLLFMQRAGDSFPWGTFTVNAVGSFAIGLCGAWVEQAQRDSSIQFTREFVMIGFLGGFTTFSAFSLQTLQLVREGKPGLALTNIAFSMLVCLAAVWLGYAMAARVTAS